MAPSTHYLEASSICQERSKYGQNEAPRFGFARFNPPPICYRPHRPHMIRLGPVANSRVIHTSRLRTVSSRPGRRLHPQHAAAAERLAVEAMAKRPKSEESK